MAIFDAIVLGLGGMGSATAYHLARRGRRVLGIEQFVPAHDRGSSHGHSRIYRQAYLEGEQYVPLLLRAYDLWRELERASGRELLRLTGGLMIGPAGSRTVEGARRSAEVYGIPYRLLDATEVRRRFPQFAVRDDEIALYEERAGALFPEDTVRAHLDLAAAAGADLRFGLRVEGWSAGADDVQVRAGGETHRAAALAITAGAWAGQPLADLRLPLRPERNVQCWWRPRAHPERFVAGQLPIFIWERGERALYGLPDLRGEGVKAAIHHSGEAIDPDEPSRAAREDEIALVRERLAEALPDLPGELRAASVCMYTNTPDEHFLIGLHPREPRVAIAAGFSGHGFKFAPVVGEILAGLCSEGVSPLPIEPFRLERFGAAPVG